MESELNRVQAENSHLRVIYQKKSEDYYLMEQQIKNEISEELNKTHQEKENSMKVIKITIYLLNKNNFIKRFKKNTIKNLRISKLCMENYL